MGISVTEENAILDFEAGAGGGSAHTHSNLSVLEDIISSGSGNIITLLERNMIALIPNKANQVDLLSHTSLTDIHHTHSNKAVIDAITNAGRGQVITTDEADRIISHVQKDSLDANSTLSYTNPVTDKAYVDGELATKVDQTDFDTHVNDAGEDKIHHTHTNKTVLNAIIDAGRGSIITLDEASRIPSQDQKDALDANTLLDATNYVADMEYVNTELSDLDTKKLDKLIYDIHVADVSLPSVDHIHHSHTPSQVNLLDNCSGGGTVNARWQMFGDILMQKGYVEVDYDPTQSELLIANNISVIFPQAFGEIPSFSIMLGMPSTALGFITHAVESITETEVKLSFRNVWSGTLPAGKLKIYWNAWTIKP